MIFFNVVDVDSSKNVGTQFDNILIELKYEV
jgi:hypothetical protein